MLQLFEYELPLHSVFRTGSSEVKNRKGVLIHYRENNIDFVSEASPLSGYSQESFAEVRQSLLDQKKWVENFLGGQLSMQTIRDLANTRKLAEPSIQFGLSFLSLSILAKRRGKTIYDLFDKEPPQQISINDVIGHASIRDLKNQIESSINKGFKVIKIKAPYPLEGLPSLLSSIQDQHPGVQFRLDANQSWPRSELISIFNQLVYLPIQYIEEPCKNINISELREIQVTSDLPIALDESISTISLLKKALTLYPDVVLIVKPMLLGNILEIHETISQFRSNFKQIVVTTTLESRIGRSMVASSAFLIGDQQMSHGLHTGHLFADDLLPDFEIENGSIINLRENPAIKSFGLIKTSYLKKLG